MAAGVELWPQYNFTKDAFTCKSHTMHVYTFAMSVGYVTAASTAPTPEIANVLGVNEWALSRMLFPARRRSQR